MIKIFKYSIYDMVRNRWMIIYFLFFLIVTLSLLLLSGNLSKLIITLSNIILALCPLIGLLFGAMYYYNSEEYIRLLLAQPLSRKSVIWGMYAGLSASLCLSLVLGISLPMLFYGILTAPELPGFLILLGVGIVLTLVFSMIAFIVALNNENKIKGIGIVIFLWLFFAIIYDGIFLLLLSFFSDYPLENLTILLVSLNPVDLGRILIMLQLDISAMMGYTGAVLQKFLGSGMGSLFITGLLALWLYLPFAWMTRAFLKKDY